MCLDMNRFSFAISHHEATGFGHVLELRNAAADDVCAVLQCIPPGFDFKTGTPEYYYAVAQTNMAFPIMTPALQLKDLAVTTCMEDHKPKIPHWYIQVLATSGRWRGHRCASKLLSIVDEWAKRDGVCCYLETSLETAPFYIRNGYRMVWRES